MSKSKKYYPFVFAVVILVIVVLALNIFVKNGKHDKIAGMVYVTAIAETNPVPQRDDDDSADDPVIWIHPRIPDSSRIIGTDKMGGLAVYTLTGEELKYYPHGLMNNADLRYGFPLDNARIDIMAVTNRTSQSVDLYRIISDGSLEVIHKQKLIAEMSDEIYGLCMYQSKQSGKYFVFANSKAGEIVQWELFADSGLIDGKLVRRLKCSTQVEGMTADDENGFLFVGEEDVAVRRFNAEPDMPSGDFFIPGSSAQENEKIGFDIEGLAVYSLPGGDGYLIASSQGNDSYAIFDRKPPHNYVGSFQIIDGPYCDGAEGTDGLDVTSSMAGDMFRHGFLVVQDGSNIDSNKPAPQNFKIVSWDSIAIRFQPTLRVKTKSE